MLAVERRAQIEQIITDVTIKQVLTDENIEYISQKAYELYEKGDFITSDIKVMYADGATQIGILAAVHTQLGKLTRHHRRQGCLLVRTDQEHEIATEYLFSDHF